MISPLNRGVGQGGGPSPGQNQAVALRVAIIGAVLLGLFAIVFFRLWYLQVLSGESLASAASKNRTRTVAITAPRGDIIDRNGKTIVRNKRPRIVELAPASLPDQEREVALEYGQSLTKWSTLITERVEAYYKARKKKVPAETPKWARDRYPKPRIPALNDPTVIRKYASGGEEAALGELQRRYERLGWLLDLPADEIRRRVITGLYLVPYANIPLRQNADPDVVEYIGENSERFEGVSTTTRYVRSYTSGAGAQFLGQVGAVPVDDDGDIADDKFKRLAKNTQVGLNGLEYQYDSELRGQDGTVRANIDAQGNVIGEPTEVEPRTGRKLQLTLDLDLQNRTQELFEAGSAFNPGGLPGAAVAMDPRNGEILAMVSNPTFDPNIFTRPVSQETFNSFIDENGGKPLFNRATEAAYPAASTFKVVTSFAALDTGVTTVDQPFNDTGKFDLGDRVVKNAGDAVNGSVDLVSALEVSSDVYFYKYGADMNTLPGQPLQKWARRLGYGSRTGIDLPGERKGVIPDRKWRDNLAKAEDKCRRKKGISTAADVTVGCYISDRRPWSLGDQVNTSVGQGDTQVTPLQSAVAYAAIENGGTIVQPRLAKATQDRSGETVQTFPTVKRRTINFDQTALEGVRRGLFAAANGDRGTSKAVFANWPTDRFPVYGKTGTAETPQGDQSWYAAYVPNKTRPIVVVTTVERGGFGAEKAAPIAAEMLKQWFRLGDGVEVSAGSSETN